MNPKRLKMLAIPAALLIVYLVTSGLHSLYNNFMLSDEEKVTLTINRAVKAVEEKSVRGLMNEISDDYKDQHHATKSALANNARYWVGANLQNDVEITLSEYTFKIGPDDESATMNFKITGNKPITDIIRYYKKGSYFTVALTKKTGSWKITSCYTGSKPQKLQHYRLIINIPLIFIFYLGKTLNY